MDTRWTVVVTDLGRTTATVYDGGATLGEAEKIRDGLLENLRLIHKNLTIEFGHEMVSVTIPPTFGHAQARSLQVRFGRVAKFVPPRKRDDQVQFVKVGG